MILLFFIQIIFLSFLFTKGIIGNPNNKFKEFISQSEVNEIISNNKIFLIGKFDDKIFHLLKFYLPKYKKIDMEDLSIKESIYGIISDEEVINLNQI